MACGLSILSCRQIVGISDDPPMAETLATTVGGLQYGTSMCASCAAASCGHESAACAADSTCASYASCVGDCKGDLKSRSQCAIDHPAGTAMSVPALAVCLATHCEDACGLRCGALAGVQTEPDAAEPCGSCLATNACDVERACARSIDCDAINRCGLACPTLDCKEACQTAHGLIVDFGSPADAGTGPWPALESAAKGTCATACGIGGYWECVGKVSWPAPKTASSTIHFWELDLSSSSGVPGTNVSVCSAFDVGCTSPLKTGTTNGAGEVSLSFPNRDPDNPGVGFTGYLTLSGGDRLPGQLYWGFPLSEPDFFAFISSVTPALFQELVASSGVRVDPARSAMNVAVFDCLGNQAPGVMVTFDSMDSETVVHNGRGFAIPTPTTDSDGVVSFFNVPKGPVRVTATPTAIQRPSAIVEVTVEGDAGIGGPTVYLAPTPMP